MIFLRWLRGPTQRIPVRCPDCGATEPNYRMLEGTNHYWQDDKVVEEITGYTVACQRCPCIYAIGPNGIYKPNNTSRPWGAVAPLPPTSPPRDTTDEEQRPQPPLPRERPRV